MQEVLARCPVVFWFLLVAPRDVRPELIMSPLGRKDTLE